VKGKRMVKVKICGITHLEDARHAIAAGADALGFVFYPPSPRCLDPVAAQAIIAELPPFVTCVGLFVNEQPERVLKIVRSCGLDAIQLHGDEVPEQCHYPSYRVIKALRTAGREPEQAFVDYPVSALLLDALVPGQYGGTGQLGDWPLAARLAKERTVILAGGLTPANVAAAVKTVRPYAVDVSSGVESDPGRKDPHKVAEFIRNAKEAV